MSLSLKARSHVMRRPFDVLEVWRGTDLVVEIPVEALASFLEQWLDLAQLVGQMAVILRRTERLERQERAKQRKPFRFGALVAWAALACSACASTPVYELQPGRDFKRDSYECSRDSLTYGGGNVAMIFVAQHEAQKMYEKCMDSLGYVKSKSR